MTTFIQFSEARKQQIQYLRDRLMTVKPTTDRYGTVTSHLGVLDYAVYAVLRGADYRKGDHTGGKLATQLLQQLVNQITYWGTSEFKYGKEMADKFLPNGQPRDELFVLKDNIEAAIVTWSKA